MTVLPHPESFEDQFNHVHPSSSSGGSGTATPVSSSLPGSRLAGIPADGARHASALFGDSIESAVSLIISELSLKQMGQHMPDGPITRDFVARVDASIAEFLDEYCAGSQVGPSKTGGPPPWVLPTVTKLSAIASTMQDGEMRNAVLGVAAIMVQKAFALAASTADLKDLIAPEENGIG